MKMYRPHRLCPRNSKPKEPSLYRSLCVSILCMFLSTVMLVGTTMAWFSDSLQTGVYTITSADFSTTVYYCTDLAGESGTNNWIPAIPLCSAAAPFPAAAVTRPLTSK